MRISVFTVTAVLALTPVLPAEPAKAHFNKHCKKNKCKRHVIKPFLPRLNRIAGCESGKRWHLNSNFDGGLQFHPSTWNATGSRYSYAFLAPPLEQKYRAVIWASIIGWNWHSTAGWPVCG